MESAMDADKDAIDQMLLEIECLQMQLRRHHPREVSWERTFWYVWMLLHTLALAKACQKRIHPLYPGHRLLLILYAGASIRLLEPHLPRMPLAALSLTSSGTPPSGSGS